MFCSKCGQKIEDEKSAYCTNCKQAITNIEETCGNNWLYTLILNWILGCSGIHRFYTGYIRIGIAQLLTLGGFGIWSFIDMVAIGLNKYKNAKGEELQGYNKLIGYVGIAYALMVMLLVISVLFIILVAIAYASLNPNNP